MICHEAGAWPARAPVLVYFFVRAEGARNTGVSFLQAVNSQLLGLLGVPGGAATEIVGLKAQFSELWSAALAGTCEEQPLLLLVDGLDEMAGEEPAIIDLLPARLAEFTHVVVSARPEPPVDELVGPEHPLRAAERRDLAAFDRATIATMLSRYGVDLRRAGELAPRVETVTRGEPLLARFVSEEVAADESALRRIEEHPPADAEDYFREQLRRLDEASLTEASWEVLGLLVAAEGGLRPEDMAEVLGLRRRAVKEALAPLRRFLLGEDALELFHKSLRDLLTGEFGAAELAGYRERLVAWGRGYAERDWPAVTPPYLLAHHARQLAEAGDDEALIGLVGREWMRRHREAEGSLAGFNRDVRLALAAARKSDRLAEELRCTLVLATISSLATAASSAAIGILAAMGRIREALDYADLLADPLRQASAYREIAHARVAQGNVDEARALLARALDALAELYPVASDAATELSEVVAVLGKAKDVDGLERARTLVEPMEGGRTSSVDLAVSSALLVAGLRDRAVALLDEVVETFQPVGLLPDEIAQAAGVAAAAGARESLESVVRAAQAAKSVDARAAGLSAAAAAYAALGDDREAKRLARRALAVSEEGSPLLRAGALATCATSFSAGVLADLGREAAVASLRAAKEMDDYGHQYALGDAVAALAAVGDLERLEQIYRETKQVDPVGFKDEAILEELAGAFGILGLPDLAIEAARSIPPGDGSMEAAAFTKAATGLANAGLLVAARTAAELVPLSQERALALAYVAEQAWRSGAASEAESLAEAAIRASERFDDGGAVAAVLGAIASALHGTGKPGRGEAAAEEAAEALDSVLPGARSWRDLEPVVDALLAVGRRERALGFVDELFVEDRARLRVRVGEAYARSGDRDAAFAVAEGILSLADEGGPQVFLAAGELLASLGDGARAAEAVERAGASEPSFSGRPDAGLLSRAVIALERAGAHDEALRMAAGLRRAESFAAADSAAAASAYAAVGLQDEAIAAARQALDRAAAEDEYGMGRAVPLTAVKLLPETDATARLERADRFARDFPAAYWRADLLASVSAGWHAIGESGRAVAALRIALDAAALAGRRLFLAVVQVCAPVIAAVDGGETLWRLHDDLAEVDGWWGD